MPKIQWTDLPQALRQHSFDRLEDREITAEDLYKLKLWRESEPDAPEGDWYKDFGSFKIWGKGKFPKTFLLKGQVAKGNLSRRKGSPMKLNYPLSPTYDLRRRFGTEAA
jgi:hypothetical protein